MRLNLAFGANEQTLPLLNRNFLAEKTPTGWAARARPGLTRLTNIDTANLRGVFRKAGIFDGDMIVLAEQTVYRVQPNGERTALTGTVSGDERVSMDGGLIVEGDEAESCVRIATGDALYKVVGSEVTLDDFPYPGGEGAADVAYGKAHWIASRPESDEVYIQLPGQTSWDPLQFATAEKGADVLVGLWPLGDYFYLFGAATTEVWRLTGDETGTTPIQPLQGLAMDVGCRARDAIASTSDMLFWVDDQCSVRVTMGGQADIVSEDWVQAKIATGDPAHLRAWACTYKQHPLYIVTMGLEGTLVYDASTKLWTEWKSKERGYFRAHLGTECDAEIFAADMQGGTGIIWKLDPEARTDNGEEIECLLTAHLPLTEGRVSIGNAVLHCRQGGAPLTGQGSSPLVGLRWSDDQGHTWGNWHFTSTGARGHYSIPPRWNRLGQVKSPYGRLFQIRQSDPVERVVYGLDVNV